MSAATPALVVTDANGNAYEARLWGSDCLACGSATAGSQRCAECGSNERTIGLWTLGDAPKVAAAKQAAWWRRVMRSRMSHYRCPACGTWHIGHATVRKLRHVR
jgi:uncharacterized OB-fold protein